jgi:hypothetical protein
MAEIYYAVRTAGGGDLKTGSSPQVTISSGVMTVDEAQTGDIGIGFEITYDTSKKCYISQYNSTTSFNVVTATGGTPSDEGTLVDLNSIAAPFTDWQTAETNASGASYVNDTDLTAGGANANLNFYLYTGTAETGKLTTSGWTTDSTHKIKWIAPTGGTQSANNQRFLGLYNAAYVRTVTTDHCLDTQNDNVEFLGLQLVYNGSSQFKYAERTGAIDTWEGLVYDSCLAWQLSTTNNCYGLRVVGDNGSNVSIVRNCIVYDFTAHGIWARNTAASAMRVDNNTVYNCGSGIVQAAGFVVASGQNNVASGSGSDFIIGETTNWDYNWSKDDTAPGANSIHADTDTLTIDFVSTTAGSEDLHLQSTSDAIGAGTDLSGQFTVDVDGETRSAWDMGADEFIDGESSSSSISTSSVSSSSSVSTSSVSSSSVSTSSSSSVVAGITTVFKVSASPPNDYRIWESSPS